MPVVAIPVVMSAEPLTGALFSVLESASTLPFTDNFETPAITNRTTQTQSGLLYPTANAARPIRGPEPEPVSQRRLRGAHRFG